MSKKRYRDFRPGDVVLVGGKIEAVIVYETDPWRCHKCDDPHCLEWSNLLTLDGQWLFHVAECDMDYSKFGYRLRKVDKDVKDKAD